MPTYTITTEGNSYFNGRDAVLSKDGERVAKIALKDNRPAIYVKVQSLGTEATRELRDDLGDERLEQIYDGLQHAFWYYVAPEVVKENGHYDAGVWSAGRSDGWCIPRAANRDNDWHWWDESNIDDPIPEHESTDELDQITARKVWFFQAAEAITAEVEYQRTEGFDDAVRDAHAELEREREAVLVRGEN